MLLSPERAQGGRQKAIYPGLPLSLEEIRLVKLQPGLWTDSIVCELVNVSLDIAQYQALSYVWGSRHVTRPICLNGRTYPVTINLEGALRHLREQYKNGLIIWIDALCINQEDIAERTQQVELMGRIYKRCQQAIVYLGDTLNDTARPDTAPPVVSFDKYELHVVRRADLHNLSSGPGVYEVFSVIQEISNMDHLVRVSVFNLKAQIEESEEKRNQMERLQLVEALRRLMQPPFTPWWHRIWVIQEVAAPPRILVVYGTVSAPWSMFATAASRFVEHSMTCCQHITTKLQRDEAKVLADCWNRILDIEELRTLLKQPQYEDPHNDELKTKRKSLLDLMRRFRDRKASDPRDKVYALLSLASTPQGRSSLLPDYSLSEVDVFREATLESIYSTKSLSVFSTELGRKCRDDLPSWVPDWNAPGGHTYNVRAEAVDLYDVGSMKDVTGVDVRPVDQAALSIEGSRFDFITRACETMWGDDPGCCRNTLHSWWRYIRKTEEESLSGQLTQSFWRMICADVLCTSQSKPEFRRTRPEDELTFVMWAHQSIRSPFYGKHTDRAAWSPTARAWRAALILWSGRSILDPSFQMAHMDNKHYIPDVSGTETSEDQRCSARDLFELFRGDLMFWSNGTSNADFLDAHGHVQQGAPWRTLLVGVTEKLTMIYGSHVDLDVCSRRKLIPMIDNSIMAATLSRGLIVSGMYVGLGPLNARRGDQIFFLAGGKTPFVLRRCSGRVDGIPSSGYEIVGDCYIQEIMDGHPSVAGNWTRILLF